jgi:hypothetical protein
MKILFIFTLIFFLESCREISFLDASGKGAKRKCLKLTTNNLTIDCNCEDKQIATMTIYSKKNSTELFGAKTSDSVFQPTINTLKLPIRKDSADKCFLQIEIHLTNSHHRETFYIMTKPGDFTKDQSIYSSYFSH